MSLVSQVSRRETRQASLTETRLWRRRADDSLVDCRWLRTECRANRVSFHLPTFVVSLLSRGFRHGSVANVGRLKGRPFCRLSRRQTSFDYAAGLTLDGVRSRSGAESALTSFGSPTSRTVAIHFACRPIKETVKRLLRGLF